MECVRAMVRPLPKKSGHRGPQAETIPATTGIDLERPLALGLAAIVSSLRHPIRLTCGQRPAALPDTVLLLVLNMVFQRSIPWLRFVLGVLLALGGVIVGPIRVLAGDYEAALKPLLRERCFSCHGALQQKAGLRLDTVAGMLRGGKHGPALVSGKAELSAMVQRVSSADTDERMPPEHEGQPFSEAQVALLKQWISEGASAPAGELSEPDPRDHWAFRPRQRPTVPAVKQADRVRNPIDAFLAKGLETAGLTPRPEAPRRLQIRRLYLDLIGLPPTEAEMRQALADGSDEGYRRTVDRLLDDPRYGERWARHWMDVWRYSDPWGLGDQHRNSAKHLWHWRDWIVESLNADLPYDEMIRLMLAADESHPDDLQQLRATGFLGRNYFLFNRNQWLDETVEHVCKAFLGLTLNCAKCHDHKYDPLPQTDYYRMRAFFEPYQVRMDLVPGEADMARDAIPRAYDRDPETPTYRFVRGQETQPDRSRVMTPGVPALLGVALPDIRRVELPPTAWQPERRPWVFETQVGGARKELQTVRSEVARASTNAPATAIAAAKVAVAAARLESVVRRAEAQRASWNDGPASATAADAARRAAVTAERREKLARHRLTLAETQQKLATAEVGKKDALAKEVATQTERLAALEKEAAQEPAPSETFSVLSGAAWVPTRFLDSTKDDPAVPPPHHSTGRRTALARWITNPANPLTARVAVNQVWNRHFGAALAPALFDFGRKGGTPEHTDLIDWLACELVDTRWSLKHLHRLIVTSAAYRMDSTLAGAGAELARDPDNRLGWRRSPIRLESQVIRDALLAHAGRLDTTRGGPTVGSSDQAQSRRRSLYFHHSNNDRNLFLTTFDEALVKECYRRETSIVPQQALALLNGRLVGDCAPDIARNLTASAPAPGDEAFVRHAFEQLLGFEPSPAELQAALEALRGPFAGSAAEAVGKVGPATGTSAAMAQKAQAQQDAPMPARARLVWSLVNHGDFVTLR